MIISRTPFRISFLGGGTDFPDFYRSGGGDVIGVAIDKYVYIVVHPSFNENNRLQYSVFEETKNVNDIKNTRIREAMKMTGVVKGVEIHVLSEMPTKAGLGGSSSFTVGLLNALYAYKGKVVSAERLAKEACEIEIEILKEPIGKQDQYLAAYGGFNHVRFNPDESVFVNPVVLDNSLKRRMKDKLMLFYTGITRDASSILVGQKNNIQDKERFKYMEGVRELALQLKDHLGNANIDVMADLLHKGWELKKNFADNVSNKFIDDCYSKALSLGALGGKLLGAGGGGFFLFYCDQEKQAALRRGMNELKEVPFRFVNEGSKIIYAH